MPFFTKDYYTPSRAIVLWKMAIMRATTGERKKERENRGRERRIDDNLHGAIDLERISTKDWTILRITYSSLRDAHAFSICISVQGSFYWFFFLI